MVKVPGDAVTGGSLNGAGALMVRATRVGGDALLMQMVRLVEAAQAGKAPIARLADVVAGYFVPAVLILGALAAVGWLWAGEGPELCVAGLCSRVDHRLPVQLGLGHAGRHHGRHGPRCAFRHPIQKPRSAGNGAQSRCRGAGQKPARSLKDGRRSWR